MFRRNNPAARCLIVITGINEKALMGPHQQLPRRQGRKKPGRAHRWDGAPPSVARLPSSTHFGPCKTLQPILAPGRRPSKIIPCGFWRPASRPGWPRAYSGRRRGNGGEYFGRRYF